ncbi:hypothetical protein BN871_EJ_00110 [Paenibacillus sp. P22]|nr:hypothetical protein BN871_EJ_00110 [Paenibacillus sp. P22]
MGPVFLCRSSQPLIVQLEFLYGLRFTEELGHRNQFVSLLAQHGDYSGQRIQRSAQILSGSASGMLQNDASGDECALYIADNGFGAEPFPILRVHVPVHDEISVSLRPAELLRLDLPVRRTHEAGSEAELGKQDFIRTADLRNEFLQGETGIGSVIVGMASDRMAFHPDPLHHIRMGGGALSDQEKGRSDMLSCQNVKHTRRVVVVGHVVESKRGTLRRSRSSSGEGSWISARQSRPRYGCAPLLPFLGRRIRMGEAGFSACCPCRDGLGHGRGGHAAIGRIRRLHQQDGRHDEACCRGPCNQHLAERVQAAFTALQASSLLPDGMGGKPAQALGFLPVHDSLRKVESFLRTGRRDKKSPRISRRLEAAKL